VQSCPTQTPQQRKAASAPPTIILERLDSLDLTKKEKAKCLPSQTEQKTPPTWRPRYKLTYHHGFPHHVSTLNIFWLPLYTSSLFPFFLCPLREPICPFFDHSKAGASFAPPSAATMPMSRSSVLTMVRSATTSNGRLEHPHHATTHQTNWKRGHASRGSVGEKIQVIPGFKTGTGKINSTFCRFYFGELYCLSSWVVMKSSSTSHAV
jgi:hypothetical protein